MKTLNLSEVNMETPSILLIKQELTKFVPNGAYFPVIHLYLEGKGDLQAVHDYGDYESPIVWEGPLTQEEMVYLRDAKLCQTNLS